jgi:hypothetical protein
MLRVKVIGISAFDFVDKKTNKNIKGVSIHYNEPINPENGQGFKGGKYTVQEAYISKVLTSPIESYFGKEVEPVFNKYGSLDSLVIVK